MALTHDRVVIVTGASNGIGRAAARELAPGATVYVTGRDAGTPGIDGLARTAERSRPTAASPSR